MITRKVDKNDHLAGFTYNWVKKIAGAVEELNVICLQSGEVAGLPDNVKVYGLNEIKRFRKFRKFVLLALRLVPKADGIFCHMNPEYTIAIAPFAKFYRKKIVSWYAHGAVNFKVFILEKLADRIITSSANGFRLASKKLIIIHQGIDPEIFSFKPRQFDQDKTALLSVGRISPAKDYESMILAVKKIREDGYNNIKLTVIGEAGLTEQNIYFDNLKEIVKRTGLNDYIEFIGARPNYLIPEYLKEADIFINLSSTGSLDKAVLEAMSCGCLVLTANPAFKEMLPPELIAEKDQPEKLAEKILAIINLDESVKREFSERLSDEVRNRHGLDDLAKKIVDQFNSLAKK